MMNLYFGNVYSVLTTLLLAVLLTVMIVAAVRRKDIRKWGVLSALLILVGTAVSGLSAMRDGYATENALFAMNGIQSNLCSIAGGLIFLMGFIGIFLRKQAKRKAVYFLISTLIIIQILVLEISRITL